MATKYEYRVSGIPDAPIIDHYGNIRPSSVWGNTYFVDYRNGADTNNGLSRGNARKTLSSAISLVTSNNWDLVVGDPDSEVVETSMITNTSNRFNIVGDTSGRILGPRFRVGATITTGATNIATFQNTGVGVGVYGVKFSNASTVAEGIYSVAEGGEYSVYSNCEIYKSTDLDVTGAAELLMNGDSARFVNCYIGSTVNATTGAILRPNVLLTRETITGKVARDFVFEDCIFARKSGDTGNRFVYGANATDVERMGLFKKCLFWNAKLSAAVPAQNVAFGSSLTEGEVLLWDCAAQNAATAMSTTTGVFVMGSVPTAATTGIAVQAS